MKKIVLTALLAMAATHAVANDQIKAQIYNDAQFEQNRTKAIQILEQKGYQVTDIDADDRMGKPVLEIEAYKNKQEYEIVMSYPDLNIIKERVDD